MLVTMKITGTTVMLDSPRTKFSFCANIPREVLTPPIMSAKTSPIFGMDSVKKGVVEIDGAGGEGAGGEGVVSTGGEGGEMAHVPAVCRPKLRERFPLPTMLLNRPWR